MPEALTLKALVARLSDLPAGRRLVAVSGPPASGKSTITEDLATALTSKGRTAQVVPMDGFHLDNATLDKMGLRARKGAPETFDAAGLLDLVKAVRAGGAVPFPTFDRSLDATVPNGGTFDADIAVFEGNYLLLDEEPWRALHPHWDASIALDVPEDVLRARLIDRWVTHGMTTEDGLARAEANDLPNARRVLRGSIAPDYVIVNH
ncbi:Phosphoribulokinase / Uridine kinase family protein [Jannaschia faecimaris]|uniref:Phosphoribulokinase / Uridine kinase family protein n=1 Tax=Jannaschia faecimaris TaxID=1244108 RepID=A0A1H3TIX2_9RHOB|nr:hypothetical protein [Jannaschia faecimaris]SDZ49751.1 Phosphoribulokinase / Uridine kinase family protein [Jannaschia faecimaris]